MFAGVELESSTDHDNGLEQKNITLSRYAYYKHIGPYNLLKQVGQNMQDELKNRHLKSSYPYIEIYGHWTDDQTKLETELLMFYTGHEK